MRTLFVVVTLCSVGCSGGSHPSRPEPQKREANAIAADAYYNAQEVVTGTPPGLGNAVSSIAGKVTTNR